MGYSTHPRLVSDNREILSQIRDTLSRGEELTLSVEGNVSTEQYRLRRILASANRHPEVFDGEFSGLGDQITLSIQGTNILVKAKGRKFNLIPPRKTLESELRRISSYPGSMDQITLSPPFDLSDAISAFSEAGWTLHPQTRSINESGEEESFVVERIKAPVEKGGFNRFA